jgi:hypothetical protein
LVKKLAAQGHPRCQEALRKKGIDYLSPAERAAEAALMKLTPEQRHDLLRRMGGST